MCFSDVRNLPRTLYSDFLGIPRFAWSRLEPEVDLSSKFRATKQEALEIHAGWCLPAVRRLASMAQRVIKGGHS